MATLILHKNTDGGIKGRCDAKCYNAKGPKCKCVCGAMNHGVGHNQATSNTHQHGLILLDAQEAGDFIIRPGQYKLFQEQQT